MDRWDRVDKLIKKYKEEIDRKKHVLTNQEKIELYNDPRVERLRRIITDGNIRR